MSIARKEKRREEKKAEWPEYFNIQSTVGKEPSKDSERVATKEENEEEKEEDDRGSALSYPREESTLTGYELIV